MVWAFLALIGVPLWLCAVGIISVVVRNRQLRKRYADIAVRVRQPGKQRWTRGHALWVSDVFAWRGSPAAWKEELLEVLSASTRPADDGERKKLRRLADDPVIAILAVPGGESLEVAVRPEQRSIVLGPFGAGTIPDASRPEERPNGRERPTTADQLEAVQSKKEGTK